MQNQQTVIRQPVLTMFFKTPKSCKIGWFFNTRKSKKSSQLVTDNEILHINEKG